MEAIFVYITCKDKNEALLVGKALLQARLAACINVLDQMTSAYWWNGEIVEEQECILIAKSKTDLFESLTQKVKDTHSYEVPCIISLPIQNGNPAYLQWIMDETQAISPKA